MIEVQSMILGSLLTILAFIGGPILAYRMGKAFTVGRLAGRQQYQKRTRDNG